VNGTLIAAWASQRSFRPKDSSDKDGSNLHGQNSQTARRTPPIPDSRLYRKAPGRVAKLSYMGHVTMENRQGLAVAGVLSKATGTTERRAHSAGRDWSLCVHCAKTGQALAAAVDPAMMLERSSLTAVKTGLQLLKDRASLAAVPVSWAGGFTIASNGAAGSAIKEHDPLAIARRPVRASSRRSNQ
jgi:hypothetical protein